MKFEQTGQSKLYKSRSYAAERERDVWSDLHCSPLVKQDLDTSPGIQKNLLMI